MMLTSRVFGLALIARLFGNLLQDVLQAHARAVDLLRQRLLVPLKGGELLAQVAVLFAQLLAQLRRLPDLLLERLEFRVHRHTIVWKILWSQGLTGSSQCRL